MKNKILSIALIGLAMMIGNSTSAQLFGKKKTKAPQEEVTQKSPQAGRYTVLGEELPFFRMRTHDGVVVKREDLDNGKKTFLVLFNPTCGSCIALGNTFKDNREAFKDYNVVFIAAHGMDDYLAYFFEQNQLDEVKEFYVGLDESNLALDVNIRDGMPQLNIYKKGWVLERIYTGSVPFEYIKKHF